jgi:hypothetical protein
MSILPVVVYVEKIDLSWIGGNPAREALIYHLKTTCDCEVYAYGNQHGFLDDFTRIRQAIESKRVLAVIVDECKYDEEQHLVVISKIRELTKTVPIIVFPHGFDGAKGIEGYKGIYDKYHNTSRRLSNLIKRWRKNIQLPLDHFDAKDTADVRRIVGQLEHVYQSTMLDGNETGVADTNGQVVAEAIRLRLCPAELFRDQFDMIIQSEPCVLQDPGRETYDQQIELIRSKCLDNNYEFFQLLGKARGNTIGGSSGDKVEGFAIDPVTLEYFRTHGYGTHQSARIRLESRIKRISNLKGQRCTLKNEKEAERRIVTGELFVQVPGFTIPIIQFEAYWVKGEVGRKIAAFLRDKRLALPISVDDEKDFELCLIEC